MKWENQSPQFDNLYNKNLNQLFKIDFENGDIGQNHMDLQSVQNKFEEIILNYIEFYKNKFDLDNPHFQEDAMNS